MLSDKGYIKNVLFGLDTNRLSGLISKLSVEDIQNSLIATDSTKFEVIDAVCSRIKRDNKDINFLEIFNKTKSITQSYKEESQSFTELKASKTLSYSVFNSVILCVIP